ncbi:MAG: methyltransferase family protein, partial [Blastocatellia bacterium]
LQDAEKFSLYPAMNCRAKFNRPAGTKTLPAKNRQSSRHNISQESFTMIFLRLYLLAGLIAHKAVWEILKRRKAPAAPKPEPQAQLLPVMLVKAAKIAILLGIIAQTMLPEILPISQGPFLLRAVGVAIYTSGLLIAVVARFQLDSNWSDIETAKVLSHQSVVSNGIYGYVRHPIYVGDILLLFGLELSLNSWLVLGVALMTPVILLQAAREEKKLVETLPGYDIYCRNTKRFIPFVI